MYDLSSICETAIDQLSQHHKQGANKKMKSSKKYRVVVRDFAVYSQPLIRECGHRHRSIRTALLCKKKLYAYNERTCCHSALWHHGEVEGIGFKVDPDELVSSEVKTFILGVK